MKPETEFVHEIIKEIEKYCKNNDLHYHITRIESNLTQQGIPDLNCCINGNEFWIEAKVDDNNLSPLQISWKEQRLNAGGKVFIFIKKKDSYSFIYKGNIQSDYLYQLIRIMMRKVNL